MARLAALWRRHKLLVLLFAGTVIVTLFFAIRFTMFMLYWRDPAHRNQPLEGWMTLGYVAHSYAVPKDRLIDALDPPQAAGKDKAKRPTLQSLARARGMSLPDFQKLVEAEIARLRLEAPRP